LSLSAFNKQLETIKNLANAYSGGKKFSKGGGKRTVVLFQCRHDSSNYHLDVCYDKNNGGGATGLWCRVWSKRFGGMVNYHGWGKNGKGYGTLKNYR